MNLCRRLDSGNTYEEEYWWDVVGGVKTAWKREREEISAGTVRVQVKEVSFWERVEGLGKSRISLFVLDFLMCPSIVT